MGPNGAQDITPLSDDEQERDGESLTRRKYFCMRLASGCLRPAETGAKMRATGGEFDNQRRRRAEETMPHRYTPQSRTSLAMRRPAFAVYGGATTCNLTDSAPIGTPCAEKIFVSNIQRNPAT